ncbi:PIN domain-like protein [Aspergillus pseudonomiae]|uniref:PIN domain-like protein n=1 Tax=Aspergillus pseudonomiae TaxID=1506151 RepID=A0A5N7DMD9_9EURO|nr:PIN domain-like protein [Aspergillus pseudonomiae]KAB8260218.1 PIN domain-like protein [Aspergillus pseudonomiae]KAE8407219.1 PIN domain-like protein [Aspergillus pseudonomiae]
MGIKGLHGLLKSIQKPCHLKKFSGQTLGVDAYGWLHRGTVACAVDLVLDRPTTKHIDFVLNRVRMLLYFGVTPYLIFDGDDLPSKAGTESDRHQRRQESKTLGLELQRKGRTAEAYQEFQKAVDVTPLMARQLIDELKKMNVQYVVAPYEADAQLVYLERQGIINGIISEDSDLLVFGAKRLLSKLDQHGDCIEINRADFTACREVSLIGWTDADFRRMCILSGCDYLPNIARLGLKTAYRCIRKYKNVEKALRMLQFEGQYHVPSNYLENFKQAELTFLYQRVFCPRAGKLVTLTPPEDDVNLEELPYIGGDVEPELAVGVACGDLDPTTKEPLVLRPAAGRVIPGIQRRQTLGSSAELKPNKPISSFFTPKRTPLAELDPNSLSPSPSQQRLLERHANASWESSPVTPRPGIARSATVNRLSSPLVRSVERNSFLAHASRASTLQATKRQRLCSETDEANLPSLPDCRSRFFAHSPGDSSPSGAKVTRSKKARKSAVDVFSDEVAEGIMTQIAGSSETANHCKDKPQTRHEPREGGHEEATPPTTFTTSEDPASAKEKVRVDGRQESAAAPSTASISEDSNPEVSRQVQDDGISKQNSSLLSKFTFQAAEGHTSPNVDTLQTKDPQAHRPLISRSPSRVKAGVTRSPSRRQRLTPLQRLGQTALARSRSLNFTPSPSTSSDLGRNLEASTSQANPIPSTRPLAQGSEDMIIPDSEEEDVDGDETSHGRTPVPFNLKRFSYTTR